jgi:ribosomal protein S18 acetylase RimI-like enzyme
VARSIRIRKASPQDAAAIAECLAAAFAPFRAQYTPGAFADTVPDHSGVLNRMERMTVYVAIANAEVVGTIACSAADQVGHLRGMAVCPEWQGHNIAQQLLQHAESYMCAAGCRRITLDTTAPLKRAIRFYKRNRYAPTGRISDFFGMPLHEYSKQLDRIPRT